MLKIGKALKSRNKMELRGIIYILVIALDNSNLSLPPPPPEKRDLFQSVCPKQLAPNYWD